MLRSFMIAAASVAVLAFSLAAFAQQPSADADQAKAMLIKAIAAVKADKTKALDMFNRGEGGFLDRDIFPFYFNMSDGKLIATQTKQVLGSDVRTFKDATGRVFGPEVFGAAKENQISEVSYMFPRPGPDTKPVQKVSFVSAVGDLGCGVGYYK